MENPVMNFLVQHYVANDVIIYDDAKAEVLADHPELEDEEKLANDDNLRKQRDFIEQSCSVEKLIALEKDYFTPQPPGPEHNPFYLSLCGRIRSKLGEAVFNGLDVNNYDAMVEAWETALTEAIDQPCSYSKKSGLDKLERIYRFNVLLTHSEKSPLVNSFCDKVCEKELDFFTEIYNKVKGIE